MWPAAQENNARERAIEQSSKRASKTSELVHGTERGSLRCYANISTTVESVTHSRVKCCAYGVCCAHVAKTALINAIAQQHGKCGHTEAMARQQRGHKQQGRLLKGEDRSRMQSQCRRESVRCHDDAQVHTPCVRSIHGKPLRQDDGNARKNDWYHRWQ